jgi:hypothetical protein
MMEIRVVLPHPEGPATMSSSPRRMSRSMPRSAITFASPVSYAFVSSRQRIAMSWRRPAVSLTPFVMTYSYSQNAFLFESPYRRPIDQIATRSIPNTILFERAVFAELVMVIVA